MELHKLAGKVDPSELGYIEEGTPEMVQEILDAIEDQEVRGADDDERYHEMVDGLVDLYNSDLLEWVGASTINAAFVEEAVEEGIADTSNFYRMLQAGQYKQYSDVAGQVFEKLEELQEERGILVEAHYDDDGTPVSGTQFEVALDETFYGHEIEEVGKGRFRVTGLDADDMEELSSTTFEDEDEYEFTVEEVEED